MLIPTKKLQIYSHRCHYNNITEFVLAFIFVTALFSSLKKYTLFSAKVTGIDTFTASIA